MAQKHWQTYYRHSSELLCNTVIEGVPIELRVLKGTARESVFSMRVLRYQGILVCIPCGCTEAQFWNPDGEIWETFNYYLQLELASQARSVIMKERNSDGYWFDLAEHLNALYFEGELPLHHLYENPDTFTPRIKFRTSQAKTHWARCRWHRQGAGKWNARISVSSRILELPAFVQEYILSHECCHLIHSGHLDAFWQLLWRYPRVDEAEQLLGGWKRWGHDGPSWRLHEAANRR